VEEPRRDCIQPEVESVEKLPHDLYDEWYVFKIPGDLGKLFQGNVFETSMQAGQVAVFTNFGPGFSPHAGLAVREDGFVVWVPTALNTLFRIVLLLQSEKFRKLK
jgi:hypothetical protein